MLSLYMTTEHLNRCSALGWVRLQDANLKEFIPLVG